MPFPIIGWALGALVVAAAGAGYKWWSDNEDSSNSNENKKYEYDPTIIIGPPQSGKTHLANWLADHILLDEYRPSNNPIKIGEFMDCSGHYEDAHYWENDIQDNKNIFYLLFLKKYIEKNKFFFVVSKGKIKEFHPSLTKCKEEVLGIFKGSLTPLNLRRTTLSGYLVSQFQLKGVYRKNQLKIIVY